jgi:hypothetical protein
MSLIRGVLLAGKFRTQHQLNTMSGDDQRNTLIVELTGRSNQSNYQSFSDDALAGAGAALVFLREAKIRDDRALKTMSADDQRNTLIVEIGVQTKRGAELQGLTNIALVLLGLGNEDSAVTLRQPSFIRGVLLAGKFRTQRELNTMSPEDQRNTLIVELTGRSHQSNFQSFNDFTLAGMGAVLVFLREAKIRDDGALKTMSADDQRNTLIVEIGAQLNEGSRLQGLINMDLVRLGLGVEPTSVFKLLPPPLQQPPTEPYVFTISSFDILGQKADAEHSDNDFLSIVVTIINPVTKSVKTLPGKTIRIGDGIKSGTTVMGPFSSDPIKPETAEIVVINYLLTNLGSSDAEEQFAQAVKVTNKVVGIVGPIAGAAVGLFFGNPQAGFRVGQEIAKGFDSVVNTLGDVFDFLGLHIGPPNCNGEVLHDTLTYQPNELIQAVNTHASKEIGGPQKSERCGAPPLTRVHFSIHHV